MRISAIPHVSPKIGRFGASLPNIARSGYRGGKRFDMVKLRTQGSAYQSWVERPIRYPSPSQWSGLSWVRPHPFSAVIHINSRRQSAASIGLSELSFSFGAKCAKAACTSKKNREGLEACGSRLLRWRAPWPWAYPPVATHLQSNRSSAPGLARVRRCSWTAIRSWAVSSVQQATWPIATNSQSVAKRLKISGQAGATTTTWMPFQRSAGTASFVSVT